MSRTVPIDVLNYIIKYKYHFLKRSRLIDLLTKVHPDSRNTVILSNIEFNSFSQSTAKVFVLNTNLVPDGLDYMKPLIKDMMTVRESNDVINIFKGETGCDIIVKTKNPYELLTNLRNWLTMDNDKKALSDRKCQELFGIDNLSLASKILNDINNKTTMEGDIVRVVNQSYTKSFYAYVDRVNLDNNQIVLKFLSEDTGERIVGETDTFDLTQDMTPLRTSGKPEMTTVGRFIINTILADIPFKDKTRFPYNYGVWDIGKFHDELAKMMVSDTNKLPVSEFKDYANNFFFIGSFTELCVPSLTPKALTTSPDMRALKQKLYLENKDKIDAGDPVAIADLEAKLIAADREYLKGDNSMRFYSPLGGKPFNIARKKMYLTVGGIEEFSKHTGDYNYVERALAEGWDPKAIPVIANEIRSGSYKRGHETQLGGAETKYIVRVFHDYMSKIEDCGTKEGITVNFNDVAIKDYIGRYVLDGNDWVNITEENMSKYDKKTWSMRSAQTCKAEGCLCYKCCGKRFSDLEIGHLAMLLAELSSRFTTLMLKSMHGTKLSVYEVNDLDSFILE